MELSPHLRWVAAIAIMAVVVVLAGSMLLKTLGETVRLSSGVSEEPADPIVTSEEPSAAAEGDGGDVSGDGDGEDGGDDGGDGGDGGDGEFPQQYTVEQGDIGVEIAERFYGDPDGWSAIAEANDKDPGAPLRVGEELTIPPPPE